MKLKSHRGASKRFKVTATGKVVYRPAGKSHLLGHKTRQKKRRLKTPQVLNPTRARIVRSLLSLP